MRFLVLLFCLLQLFNFTYAKNWSSIVNAKIKQADKWFAKPLLSNFYSLKSQLNNIKENKAVLLELCSNKANPEKCIQSRILDKLNNLISAAKEVPSVLEDLRNQFSKKEEALSRIKAKSDILKMYKAQASAIIKENYDGKKIKSTSSIFFAKNKKDLDQTKKNILQTLTSEMNNIYGSLGGITEKEINEVKQYEKDQIAKAQNSIKAIVSTGMANASDLNKLKNNLESKIFDKNLQNNTKSNISLLISSAKAKIKSAEKELKGDLELLVDTKCNISSLSIGEKKKKKNLEKCIDSLITKKKDILTKTCSTAVNNSRNAIISQISSAVKQSFSNDLFPLLEKLNEVQGKAENIIVSEELEYNNISDKIKAIEIDILLNKKESASDKKQIYSLADSLQKNIQGYQNKIIESVKEYKAIIANIFNLYKKYNKKINTKDKSDIAVDSIKDLINFHIKDIKLLTNWIYGSILKKRSFDFYLPMLNILILRLKNYDSGIKNIINSNISNKESQSNLYNFYVIQKGGLVLGCYLSVLQSLRSNDRQITLNGVDDVKKISSYILAYLQSSKKFQNDLKPVFKKLGYDSIESMQKILTEISAELYISMGHKYIKSMRVGKDNSKYLDEAIDLYQKAYKFYQTIAKTNLANQLKDIYNNLEQARASMAKADAAGSLEDKLQFYKTAELKFKKAGDAVNAQEAENKIRLLKSKLNIKKANSLIKKAQKVLNSIFSKTYNGQDARKVLRTYFDFINSIDSKKAKIPDSKKVKIPQLLLKDISSNCNNAYSLYLEALEAFQKALKTLAENSKLKSEVESEINSLPKIISFLLNLHSGMEDLFKGDSVIAFSQDALFKAESFYQSSNSFFAAADDAHKSIDKKAVPYQIYPSFIKADISSWSLFLNRYIAKKYVDICSIKSNKDKKLLLLFYLLAYMRQPDLTKSFNSYILTKIKAQKDTKGKPIDLSLEITDMINRAKKADWNPDPKAMIYSSKANDIWKNIMFLSLMNYNFNKTDDNKQYFLKNAKSYLDAYLKYKKSWNKPFASNEPNDIETALIYYWSYLFNKVNNESTSELAKITSLISKFIEELKGSYAAFSSDKKNLSNIESIMKVIAYKNILLQAIKKEHDILQKFVDGKQLLLKQKIENKKITIIFIPNPKISVTLPEDNQVITKEFYKHQADIYKQQADAAFNKNQYLKAYHYYSKAKAYYDQIGYDFPLGADKLEQLKTLATAKLYEDYVFTIDSGNFGIDGDSFKVPIWYYLKVSKVKVPSDIISTVKNKDVYTVYKQIEIYNSLKDSGSNYSDYFAIDTFKSLKNFPNVSILSKADKDSKKLKAWAGSNIVTIAGRQLKPKVYLSSEYDEIYLIIALPSLPITPSAPGKLTPLIYYSGAAKLYSSGADKIQIGGKLYVPGNKPKEAERVKRNIVDLYLSEAYVNQFVFNPDNKKTLLPSFQSFDKFISTFRPINNAMQQMLMDVDFAKEEYQKIKGAEKYVSKLDKMLKAGWKQAALYCQKLLKGDPSSDLNSYILREANAKYIYLENYLNIEGKNKVDKEIALMYKNMADSCLKYKYDSKYGIDLYRFLSAPSFYSAAIESYNNIINRGGAGSDNVLTNIKSINIDKLKALYYGASQNLRVILKALKTGDLHRAINAYNENSYGEDFTNYQEFKSMILDAFIYYMGIKTCSFEKDKGCLIAHLSSSKKNAVSSKKDDSASGDKLIQKVVTECLKENKINMAEYISSSTKGERDIIQEGQSTSSKKAKSHISQKELKKMKFSQQLHFFLTGFLLNEKFGVILSEVFEKLLQDYEKNESEVCAAISSWAGYIYFVMAEFYIAVFEGITSDKKESYAKSWLNLMQSIKSEQTAIMSSASSYIDS